MLIHSPNDLALAFIKQRKKLQLSQAAVGNLVGLKQTTISAFENKPGATKLETLFDILSAIKFDLRVSEKDEPSKVKEKWKEEW